MTTVPSNQNFSQTTNTFNTQNQSLESSQKILNDEKNLIQIHEMQPKLQAKESSLKAHPKQQLAFQSKQT